LFPHVPLGIPLCSQAFNASELCSHQQLILAGALVLSQFPAESSVPRRICSSWLVLYVFGAACAPMGNCMGTQIKFIAIRVILCGKILVVFEPENSD